MKKIIVGKWLAFPDHKPILGENIIVRYINNGINKDEFIHWTFKTMTNAENKTGLEFMFFRLPPSNHH